MGGDSMNRIHILIAYGLVGVVVSASSAQLCDPVETQIVTPPNGGIVFQKFGSSAAVLGDRVVFGSTQKVNNAHMDGAVYTYEFINSSWVFQSELLPTVLSPTRQGQDEFFGISLDLDTDLLVVGATGTDQVDFPFFIDTGSVYIYRHDGSAWSSEANIFASDGDFGDDFGRAVAVDGNTVLVGAPTHELLGGGITTGAVYVYRYDGVSWLETEIIQSPSVENFASFGNAIGLDGNVFVVGSSGADGGTFTNSGLAFVYRSVGGVITYEATLAPSDPALRQYFGTSVAISGNKIVVGAPGDPALGTGDPGEAYLFVRSNGQWNQVAIMRDAHGFLGDRFGESVAIDGDTIIIGAPSSDENGVDTGQIYSYTIDSGSLSNPQMIRASDGADGDIFGSAVTVSGEHVLATAPEKNSTTGVAYALSMACPNPCPADLTGDGSLNFFDVSAFLGAFGNNEPVADFTGDGAFNFFDVSAFLSAFGAGCP